jgi:tRNA 2-selenouridine synthase
LAKNISASELAPFFLNSVPMIDVRAPVEFNLGGLPGAVNLPIMNDDERAQVGTAYKKAGRETAMSLGHKLVSGEIQEARIQGWLNFIEANPNAILYCFRGGLRSQITQRWLAERGQDRPLIEGGFKAAREFLRLQTDTFSRERKFLLLSGSTGSAKTHLIHKISKFYPTVDLEALARHRGSAFGAWDQPQPPQVEFENTLAVSLMKLAPDPRPWIFEDESRMIGRSVLPEDFFLRMRASDVILVDETFEQRIENIYQDYVVQTCLSSDDECEARTLFAKYRAAAQAISRKLGGLRTQEVLEDLRRSEEDFLAGRGLQANRSWIAKLLQYYYDPLYLGSLEKRQPKILFRGGSAEILDILKTF